MNKPDIERIRQIVTEALQREPEERPAMVEAACQGDAALLKEVGDLLAAAAAASVTGFMDSSPARVSKSLSDFGAATVSEGPGTRIGAYRILQLIGQGGFGSVFMAEQERPIHRRVALKIIKLGMDTRAVIARFEAERQALAIMDHPNIARVLDAGATDTGRPYFVMELVKGDPITDYCDANHLSVAERLDLMVQVCHAVQHAHQRGIIHRDIKPGNVLASTQDGRPFAKVIDFGISKALADRLTEKTLFTEFRQFIGTPEYMSPEQAGGALDIDTRTDVYALGALLYELLTGSAPFDAKELRSAAYEEIRRIIREVELPKPSTRLSQSMKTLPGVAANRRTEPKRLGGLVRGELDWIVMKALEKDRSRRYESASAMAGDLRRHIAGEAVIAAPPTAVYQLRKFIARHKVALTVTAALFVVLVAGMVVSTYEAMRATRARDIAETARVDAEAAQSRAEHAQAGEAEQMRLAKRELAEGLVSQAESLRLEKRFVEAHDCLLQSRDLFHELKVSLLPADLGLLSLTIENPPALMEYHFNARFVTAIALSADGRSALCGGSEGMELWNVATGTELRTFPTQPGVLCVAFSPDGHTALSGGYDRTMKLWDVTTGRELHTFSGHKHIVSCVAFSPDGRTAISGSYDNTLKLWDIASGKELRTFLGHSTFVSCVAFSRDGRTALSGGFDDSLKLWDVATGEELPAFRGAKDVWPRCIAISPVGDTALTGGASGRLKLWNVTTGKQLRAFEGNMGIGLCIAFSPDGRTVATGGDNTVELWDVVTGKELRTFWGHRNVVCGVAFSPDGRTVLSGSKDDTMKLWDVASGKEQRIFSGHTSDVYTVAFSSDGRMGLSSSDDGTVKLWDIATGRELRTFSHRVTREDRIAFSPDGRTVIFGGEELKYWDIASGKELRTISLRPDSLSAFAFSPDRQTALSCFDLEKINLWNIATGKEEGTLPDNAFPSNEVAFSPDGRTILVGGSQEVKLWDVGTSKLLRTFPQDVVHGVTFSADGRTFLASGAKLTIWDTASGKKLCTLSGQADVVYSAVFSPDGRTVLGESLGDNTLKLWDVATGKELHSFSGHTQHVFSVAFSPDGSAALSGSADTTMVLWDFGRVEAYFELQGRVESAQKVLQSNPRDSSALAVIGQWYAFRGVDKWAVEFLEQAQAGGASVSPLMIARCYWNLNRYSDARREYTAAWESSNDPQLRLYLQLCIAALDRLGALPKGTNVNTQP